jgi:hypothetical protein
LETVFSSTQRHVVLIDDALLFVGENDYPALDALREYVSRTIPDYTVLVLFDIICCLP